MTFLFWNLNRRPLLPLVQALVSELAVDVLILAENTLTDVQLLSGINSSAERPPLVPPFHYPPEGIRILTVLDSSMVEPVHDGTSISIVHLRPPVNQSFLLAVVHLPSKLYLQESEQGLLAPRAIGAILKAEEKVGHSRTLVVGDFNMNPFEIGLAGSEGFHGVMTRDIAAGGARTVQGEVRRYFYNPMWNHFGNRETPGTYYDRRGRPLCFFWNLYDQVLVRPDLLSRFEDEVEILTTAGDRPLVTASKKPDIANASDHLPILFRLTGA